MKAFKAYDIRGAWNIDFNAETVYRIGFFLPQVLKTSQILIGRDCRLSSDELLAALVRGITDAGVDVADAGLATTPMVYWATAKFGYNASVMITASHNPKSHNGLKVSAANALPVGYDNGLNKLEELVLNGSVFPVENKGSQSKVDVSTAYLDFLKGYTSDFEKLRIGIDCSNGMASMFVKELFGNDAFYINDKADGNFPGHDPNPLEPANQEQIKGMVINRQCDIGLIFDGDADRVMFIDENGRFISPDLIIALMGHYFFEQRSEKGKVLQDIRSSRSIAEYLDQFGIEVDTWRVGRAYGATKLREIDGIYGGELAGHYYFREFYYSDSALLAALIVLKVLIVFKESGFSFSRLMNNISRYYSTGEINFKIEQKQAAMDAVRDYFLQAEEPDSLMDFDGYRLDYQDWWLNIRASNTEPYLRFMAEAKNEDKLGQVLSQVKELISKFEN